MSASSPVTNTKLDRRSTVPRRGEDPLKIPTPLQINEPYRPGLACFTNYFKQLMQNAQIRFGGAPLESRYQKQRLVVVGSGWVATNLLTRIDLSRFNVTVVTPRNYFTLTPLLPCACVGTLSQRACMEPLREVLTRGGRRMMELLEGWAVDLDIGKRQLLCRGAVAPHKPFNVPYDLLVLSVGAETNTFGISGVDKYAHFLKEVEDAEAIRRTILNCCEEAALPSMSEEDRKRLLHFVVVGGGPTGVETAAEIADFLREDSFRHFGDIMRYAKITLVEMLPKVLPTFSSKASALTVDNMRRLGIQTLLQSRVTGVTEQVVTIEGPDKQCVDLPYGLLLWASGVGQVPFARRLMEKIEAQKGNRILCVNEHLQLVGAPNIFAAGDCATIRPRSLLEDADPLFRAAYKTQAGSSVKWLLSNASRLSSTYPQLSQKHVKEFLEAEGLSNKHRQILPLDEFKSLLKLIDSMFKSPPPTAQNARQQGIYLSILFNQWIQNVNALFRFARPGYELVEDTKGKPEYLAPPESLAPRAPAYIYNWKGSMAYVGGHQSVICSAANQTFFGRIANYIWRTFYLSQQLTVSNQIVCVFDWVRCGFLGRDSGKCRQTYRVPPSLTLEADPTTAGCFTNTQTTAAAATAGLAPASPGGHPGTVQGDSVEMASTRSSISSRQS